MAGDLPLIEIVPLATAILTIIIAVFALYKYIRIEKKQSDLVIGIAFLLLTLAMVVLFIEVFNSSFFSDMGLGGLDVWLTFLGFLVFLITIEPMKVINHFRENR
ncbi:MAG: hypothetical protein ACFFFG_02790 [Candidatus Thorarchaeota archaeon]